MIDTVDDDAFLDDDNDQPALSSLNDPFAALAAHHQPTAPQPLPQAIDPTAWALEFEQSAPLLRAHTTNTTTKEWRTHLETTQKHSALLTQLSPALLSELDRQRVVLSKCVERIGAKERWMNKEYESPGRRDAHHERLHGQHDNELQHSHRTPIATQRPAHSSQ